MSKVAPIGGGHKSASSMLAEAMADVSCKRAIVCWFDGEKMSWMHFEVTRTEMAYAAATMLREATDV